MSKSASVIVAVILGIIGGGAAVYLLKGPVLSALAPDTELGVTGGKPGQAREKKILYWKAPMDPNYISQEPGKSPMGMDQITVY